MSILHPLRNQVKRPSVSIFLKERGKKSQKQEKLATTYLNLANTKMATFAKLNLQGLLWNKDHHRDKDLQERAPTVLGQEFLIREKKNLLKIEITVALAVRIQFQTWWENCLNI